MTWHVVSVSHMDDDRASTTAGFSLFELLLFFLSLSCCFFQTSSSRQRSAFLPYHSKQYLKSLLPVSESRLRQLGWVVDCFSALLSTLLSSQSEENSEKKESCHCMARRISPMALITRSCRLELPPWGWFWWSNWRGTNWIMVSNLGRNLLWKKEEEEEESCHFPPPTTTLLFLLTADDWSRIINLLSYATFYLMQLSPFNNKQLHTISPSSRRSSTMSTANWLRWASLNLECSYCRDITKDSTSIERKCLEIFTLRSFTLRFSMPFSVLFWPLSCRDRVESCGSKRKTWSWIDMSSYERNSTNWGWSSSPTMEQPMTLISTPMETKRLMQELGSRIISRSDESGKSTRSCWQRFDFINYEFTFWKETICLQRFESVNISWNVTEQFWSTWFTFQP